MAEAQKNMRGAICCLAPWRLPAASGLTPILSPSRSSLVPSSARRGPPQARLFPGGRRPRAVNRLGERVGNETANIGREGAFGLFAAMYSRVSFNRCLVQLEGSIVRCPIELLQSELKHSEHVRDLFVSYSETLLSQVQQTVACNARTQRNREYADGSS